MSIRCVVAVFVVFLNVSSDSTAFGADPDVRIRGKAPVIPLALIKEGDFYLGAEKKIDMTSREDEGPRKKILISRAFFLGTAEVTQSQFVAVMGFNPSFFKGDDLPVERVTWGEASEFCGKLSRMTGETFRLPTEAEWEFACKAGVDGPYGFEGSIFDHSNCNGKFGFSGVPGPFVGRTVAVRKYLSGPNGVFDMHGNVSEWCEDYYRSDSYKANSKSDPLCTQGEGKVHRGGSWNDPPWRCRSTSRHAAPLDTRSPEIGFRVVKAVRK